MKRIFWNILTFFLGVQASDIFAEAGLEKKKLFSLNGTVTATTDYMFRGFSESDRRPAAQGGLVLKFEKLGLYASIWGSTVRILDEETIELDQENSNNNNNNSTDNQASNIEANSTSSQTQSSSANQISDIFSATNTSATSSDTSNSKGKEISILKARATLELTTAIGITNSLSKQLSYDFFLVRYLYPGAKTFEYNEGIFSVTYGFLTGLIGYSNNVFNSGGSGTYYNLSADIEIPKKVLGIDGLSIGGSVGHYHLSPIVGNSYNDYSISLIKKFKNVKFSLVWMDTNRKLYHNRLDQGRLMGMVTIEL